MSDNNAKEANDGKEANDETMDTSPGVKF